MTFPKAANAETHDLIRGYEEALAEFERRKDEAMWRLVAKKLPSGVSRLTNDEVLEIWRHIDAEMAQPRMRLACLRGLARD